MKIGSSAVLQEVDALRGTRVYDCAAVCGTRVLLGCAGFFVSYDAGAAGACEMLPYATEQRPRVGVAAGDGSFVFAGIDRGQKPLLSLHAASSNRKVAIDAPNDWSWLGVLPGALRRYAVVQFGNPPDIEHAVMVDLHTERSCLLDDPVLTQLARSGLGAAGDELWVVRVGGGELGVVLLDHERGWRVAAKRQYSNIDDFVAHAEGVMLLSAEGRDVSNVRSSDGRIVKVASLPGLCDMSGASTTRFAVGSVPGHWAAYRVHVVDAVPVTTVWVGDG